jgi:hypothetical protein
MPEPQRLYFGNPTKTLDMRPMPKGERKVFGEKQLEPAKTKMLPEGAVVLAFGNRPINPMNDTPFQNVEGKLGWLQQPKP